MTDEELRVIRERCDAATRGPWIIQYGGADWKDRPLFIRGAEDSICKNVRAYVVSTTGIHAHDIPFIAASRTDIPALLEEVECLRKCIKQLETEIRIITE